MLKSNAFLHSLLSNKRNQQLVNLHFVGILIASSYVLLVIGLASYGRWRLTQPQYLPIAATLTAPTGERLDLEVARTPEEKMRGLRYREQLPPDRGMVFPLEYPKQVTFWMAKVEQPLDVVMLRDNKIVALHRNVPACNLKQISSCPTYTTTVIDFLLELPAGSIDRLNLKPGINLPIALAEL